MSSTALTPDDLRGMRVRVSGEMAANRDVPLQQVLAELGELETLKQAIEARQAALALEVDRLMRTRAAERGEPTARQGRGVAEAVASARRIAPAHGRSVVATARQFSRMPELFTRFRRGELSEYKATLIAREAAVLDPPDQRLFDRLLAGTAGLDEVGTRKLAHRAQQIALQLDEQAAVRRRERAVSDRHVTVRPTDRGDGMAWLIALLPVEQAAAVKSALEAAAATAIAFGVATSANQVMADTLVTRVTDGGDGLGLAQPSHPIRLNLLMTDRALLGGQHEPAFLTGAGPIAAGIARQLIDTALEEGQRVELQRLYADPGSGSLVAMESKSRLFPAGLRHFIKLRDQLCRTPACGAPIAHIDHITDWSSGGGTTASNAQGLCRQCNWAKQVIATTASDPPALIQPRDPGPPRLRIDYVYEPAA